MRILYYMLKILVINEKKTLPIVPIITHYVRTKTFFLIGNNTKHEKLICKINKKNMSIINLFIKSGPVARYSYL